MSRLLSAPDPTLYSPTYFISLYYTLVLFRPAPQGPAPVRPRPRPLGASSPAPEALIARGLAGATRGAGRGGAGALVFKAPWRQLFAVVEVGAEIVCVLWVSVGRGRGDRVPWPCGAAAPAYVASPALLGLTGRSRECLVRGAAGGPGLAPCAPVWSVRSALGRGGTVAAPGEKLLLSPSSLSLSPLVSLPPALLPPSLPSRGCHRPEGLRRSQSGVCRTL